MASFNCSPNVSRHDGNYKKNIQSKAEYYVPSPSSGPILSYFGSATNIENRSYIRKQLPDLAQITSSSNTFMDIKCEPCQVSEVTTSNNNQSGNQRNSKTTTARAALLENETPKMSQGKKDDNLVPFGIAVGRKRALDNSLHAARIEQTKDVDYIGRADDSGRVPSSSLYTAEGEYVSRVRTEDELYDIHTLNETSSAAFWHHPSTYSTESLISMSSFGLQYPREASRAQLVLLPATAATDPFQQTAFSWPSYMQQNTAGCLQTAPHFMFPPINQTTSGHPHLAPMQILGSSYLISAAVAEASMLSQRWETNANPITSFLSDNSKIEQPQRQISIRVDDWNNEHNFSSKNNQMHMRKLDKLKKDTEITSSETNQPFLEQTPLLTHDQPSILVHNSSAFTPFMDMSLAPNNLMPSADVVPILGSQATQEVEEGLCKNPNVRSSYFSNPPQMQDVNVQTDTPVYSDDENTFDISPLESQFRGVQSEKNKQISYFPNQCQNKSSSFTEQTHKSSGESSQSRAISTDYSKSNLSLNALKMSRIEGELKSIKPVNKLENSVPERDLVPSYRDLSFKIPTPSVSDMSGLELLSNISTGSFVSHDSLGEVSVKQEPIENVQSEPLHNYTKDQSLDESLNISYSQRPEEKTNTINNSSMQSSESSLGGLNLLCALAEQRIQEEVESNNIENVPKEDVVEVKRKKNKRSKIESHRKSPYHKKNKNRKKELKKYLKGSSLESDLKNANENLSNIFRKFDRNYKKKYKWPKSEDIFKEIEYGMRLRLADITKQYKKKKRKLAEINRLKKKKRSSSLEYKFASISCKNPNFIYVLDQVQSTSPIFPFAVDNSERKNINEHVENLETVEKEHNTWKLKQTLLRNSKLPRELQLKVIKKKEKQLHCFGSEKKIKAVDLEEKSSSIQPESENTLQINKELFLTNEHLYRAETRVLTDMGGLFYAGVLKPLQPPDVYSITFDGERGNKSHIMSREEIFKDTILEVSPTSKMHVAAGTRLCAYWSQQYRCLYPGKAVASDPPETGFDFVSVEFDDGDSGRIRLQNIRFLPDNYPIVEYSENPFNALGINKRSTSIKSEIKVKISKQVRPLAEETNCSPIGPNIDQHKSQFENNGSKIFPSEAIHKHRKHKRKKHKKHHRSTPKNHIASNDVENIYKKQPVMRDDTKKKSILRRSKSQNNRKAGHLCNADENLEQLGNDDVNVTSNVVSDISNEAKSDEKLNVNSVKGSKIAPFLPERQLWSWFGQPYHKGKARKQFYRSITRGQEILTVGDCAVFFSTGRPDRPYIGRIEAMWETATNNKVVKVRWFYHPEETFGCPNLKYPRALFDSPHEDENDVQTISHKCEVIQFSVFQQKYGFDLDQTNYEYSEFYYLSGYYNPRLKILNLQHDIPIHENTNISNL